LDGSAPTDDKQKLRGEGDEELATNEPGTENDEDDFPANESGLFDGSTIEIEASQKSSNQNNRDCSFVATIPNTC